MNNIVPNSAKHIGKVAYNGLITTNVPVGQMECVGVRLLTKGPCLDGWYERIIGEVAIADNVADKENMFWRDTDCNDDMLARIRVIGSDEIIDPQDVKPDDIEKDICGKVMIQCRQYWDGWDGCENHEESVSIGEFDLVKWMRFNNGGYCHIEIDFYIEPR